MRDVGTFYSSVRLSPTQSIFLRTVCTFQSTGPSTHGLLFSAEDLGPFLLPVCLALTLLLNTCVTKHSFQI